MDEVKTDSSEVIARLTRERDEALVEVEFQSRLIKELVFEVERQEAENDRLRQENKNPHRHTISGEDYIFVLADEWETCKAEVERLRQCCTQRGARMQIMRKAMMHCLFNRSSVYKVWDAFCHDHPEANDWFDEDGVPK